MAGFIRKRGKSYQVILEYGKDAEGNRIRKAITVKTSKEANAILTEHEHNMQNNNYVLPTSMTYAEFLTYWFDNYVKKNCEETTQIGYKHIVEKYLKPKLGIHKLQELQPIHIQKYYKYLMDEVGFSPNTVYRHHANIRKSLDFALKQQFVMRNVADAVELPKRKEFEGSYYTIEQLQHLQELLKGHELEIPINLAIYLGLRRGEIAGLKWKFVNMESHTVEIKEVRVRMSKETITKKPKTKSSIRTLHIPDDLYSLLESHKAKQEQLKKDMGKDYRGGDYVCTKNNGVVFRPEKISMAFKKFLEENNNPEKNDLPHIRLHDLRHGFATLLYKNGVPIKNISEALGHSDITTTLKVYTHLMDDSRKETIDKMNDMLKQKPEKKDDKKDKKK